MSRSAHWHIELEPWALAHPGLTQDVWDAIKRVPGVRQINDLEVLSLHTLNEWLLPADESLVPARTGRKRKTKSE